ncbi:aspartyl protease family protein 2-like [Impatiens glandulifera]|uniref:aspartyl protease family protein 2-like n=1 Tax=Impatiens glandulifera TaxID=253017 RepID=UPI001FB0A57B|nr:aspartyl protease family protein 2-like [Impatiens glandulifera]
MTVFSTLSILISLISLQTTFSNPLQYQTLSLNSLPKTLPLPSHDEFHPQELTGAGKSSLSFQLHHLDSLISYNSTPEHLFNLRLQRDAKRVFSLCSAAAKNITRRTGDFSSSVISGLAQGSGEYFTRFGIGTPPRYAYMVLDTGSDIVWIQCSPCRKCYTQSDRLFNPARSTSYSPNSCDSPVCRRLDNPGCDSRRKTCLYQVSYGDGSFTVGDFATETFTFRGNKVEKVAFGCGHDNEGLFVAAAGLLGLGRGKLSFPGQTGHTFNQKFSYCLVDRVSSSKPSTILFGNSAVSRNAVFTPLLTNPKLDTFYYLGLVGLSVGGTRVPGVSPSIFEVDSATGNGGVIIDSGTSVTRLTNAAYTAFRDSFRAGAYDLKRAPNFSLFDTCFDLSGKKEVKVPTVVLHFAGADVSLPASNYLIPVDTSGTFCFAFAGTNSGLSIIGNIQQQGFRIVYDLASNRVGFAARGCV